METTLKNGDVSTDALLNETAPENRFLEAVHELVCSSPQLWTVSYVIRHCQKFELSVKKKIYVVVAVALQRCQQAPKRLLWRLLLVTSSKTLYTVRYSNVLAFLYIFYLLYIQTWRIFKSILKAIYLEKGKIFYNLERRSIVLYIVQYSIIQCSTREPSLREPSQTWS